MSAWYRSVVYLVAIGAFLAPMSALRAGELGSAADVALLAALVVGGVAILDRPPPRSWFQPYGRVLLGAAALGLAGVAGTFAADDTAASLLNGARLVVGIGGTCLAVAIAHPSERQLRRLGWAYVAGASMSAAAAAAGVAYNTHSGRAAGLAFHPNALGGTSVLALLLFLGLVSTSPRAGGRHTATLIVRSVIAIALGAGILESGSRAAVLGSAVGCLAFVLLTGSRQVIRVALAAASLLLVLLLTGTWHADESTAVGRLLGDPPSVATSNAERANLRQQVLDRVSDHPVFGSGFENAVQAHNLYIEVADIGGVLGVGAFTYLVWAVLRPLWRHRRDRLAAAGWSLVLAFLAAGVVSNPIWDRWIWMPIALSLAACNLDTSRRRAHGGTASSPLTRPIDPGPDEADVPHRSGVGPAAVQKRG